MDKGLMPNISLRDVLRVIFKRKTQMLVFFSVTVCVVAVGTLMMQPTYEAGARILVKVGREDVYVPNLPGGGSSRPFFNLDYEERVNSEIQILKSQFLARKVVESLGPTVIYEDLKNTDPRLLNGNIKGLLNAVLGGQSTSTEVSPAEKAAVMFQKDLTVEVVRKSSVVNITFKHTDPRLAAKVINTFVSLYLDHHVAVHKSPQSYEFFEQQAETAQNYMKRADAAMLAFKKEHNISSLEEQRLLLLRNNAERRTALSLALSQGAETRARIRKLRDQVAATPKAITLHEEKELNPPALTIGTLQARLVELELKEKELLSKYTDQNRLVRDIRDAILIVRKRLAELESRKYGMTRTGVNPVRQALDQELLRNEAEVRALTAKIESLQDQLADDQKALETLNETEMEFSRLRQQVDAYRENYRLYLTKSEESRISDAMDVQKIANVSVIEPATTPLKPVSPTIFLNMVLAVFLGALGALGLAFFSEYMDDRLEKTEDVEDHLQLPVLASIPQLKELRE